MDEPTGIITELETVAARPASTDPVYSPSSTPKLRLTGMPDADPAQTKPAVLDAIRQAWAKRLFPVYLHGPTGTGKSYAAAVVAQGWWIRECEAAKKQDREPRRPFWWS